MAVEHFLPSAIAHFEPADLIGALTTGIVMLDSDLCVVYANVAAQDLLAVSVNQARGKPFLSVVLAAESLVFRQIIEHLMFHQACGRFVGLRAASSCTICNGRHAGDVGSTLFNANHNSHLQRRAVPTDFL